MPPRVPLTTPSWQQAVQRRTTFYLLVAALLAILFGVLVFYPYAQRQGAPLPTTLATWVAGRFCPHTDRGRGCYHRRDG